MATWPHELLFELTECLKTADEASGTVAVLPKSVLLRILAKLKIATLYQVACVSKDCCLLARQACKSLYTIQGNGNAYPNYTRLLHEHDALVRGAKEEGGTGEATRVLRASPEFVCIQAILEAGFGYCISYAKGHLLEFCLHEHSFDTLNDERTISVLPYILDERINDRRWGHFINRLVELGRFDLLNQMTFSNISPKTFCQLMSTQVPRSVIVAAAAALRQNAPTLELSSLLVLAGFGGQAATLPEDLQMPLFLLQHFYAQRKPIPDGCVFIDGLEESSISFWMYVLGKGSKGAKSLLGLVLQHGDDSCRLLASAFYGPVAQENIAAFNEDVYQAMLTRFRFSPACNAHVIQNYDTMLEGASRIRCRFIWTIMDCGQAGLLDRYTLYLSEGDWEVFIDKMRRYKGSNLESLLQDSLKMVQNAPELLRRLVKRRAGDSYVQLVWSSIQSTPRYRFVKDHCCSAPLEALKSLVFEQDMAVDTVQVMLSMLDGFECGRHDVPKEVHALYTLMFWEASEKTIGHFIDQMPRDWRLDLGLVRSLLRSTKYSRGFSRRLIQCLGGTSPDELGSLLEFRPDLLQELGLQ